MIAETCGCGSSFQADRQDELKLLNAWRTNHKCRTEGNLAIVDTSRNETAHPIGFLATGLVDPARSPSPDWDDE